MHRRAFFTVAWLLALLAVPGLSITSLGADAAEDPRELWYELLLRDQHCGWVRAVEDRVDGNLRTLTETHLRLDRAGQGVTIEMGSEFVETPKGVPVRLVVRTATGGPKVETEYAFPESPTAGPVKVTTRQGPQVRESSEPWPDGEWLPPRAAERFFAERRAAGAGEVVYRTIDGQAGLVPATVTATRLAVKEGEDASGKYLDPVSGRTLPVTRWRVVNSLVPVESTMVLSIDGAVLSTATMLGSERLVSRLSTRERATRIDGGGPELLLSLMVKPDRPLRGVERSRSMIYRVSVAEGTLPDLPTAGAQRFARRDPASGTLRVALDEPQPASAEEIARPEYRAPSSTVESDDPLVIQLTEEALRGHESASPQARAERLRRAVARHVSSKGLATAFASAAETARSREGDCSEHAVLLAAMLRAAGIPSRVAVGLVYADQFAGSRDVFGWHMWTQALVPSNAGDGETSHVWLDLDATMPGSITYHAGHILTGVSDLAAGPTDPALAQVVPLLGRLRIEVGEGG